MKKSQRTSISKWLFWGTILIILFLVFLYKSGLVESYCSSRINVLPSELATEKIYPEDFPKDVSFNGNVNWMTRSRLEKIKCENNPLTYSLKEDLR